MTSSLKPLQGEGLIASKAANAVIRLDEYGLSELAVGQLMGLIGMSGKEAIGGHLLLTNYRLVFEAHSFNRLTGSFSLFLPTILQLRDTSGVITKKMMVVTKTQRLEFVIWGVRAFAQAVAGARDALTPDQRRALLQGAMTGYDRCGEGLQIHQGLEAANRAAVSIRQLSEIVKLATNPIEASSILSLLELFTQLSSGSQQPAGS